MTMGIVAAPLSNRVSAAPDKTRQQLFIEAASEFGVPQDILLAISYNQSRWENHAGQPSASGGYGLMHLTAALPGIEDGRGDITRLSAPRNRGGSSYTLDKAAALLKVPAKTLKYDDRQNVRGAAALLSDFAKEENNEELPSALPGWYDAVARVSGFSDAGQAQEFAADVFATMHSGASSTTSDGQRLVIPANNAAQLGAGKTLQTPLTTSEGSQQTECPPTITCRFVPARFAQNNADNPADYGNYDTANRPADMKIKYIVIHDTEGSYDSSIAWFQDPQSYVAAHYIIRSSDGEATQMIKTKDIGWHAGNWYMNMHSIGVEHEGFAVDGATWYSDAMYQSSAKLVRYLAKKYDIPLDRKHIIGHEQFHGLTPARAKLMHNDPGPYWDWEYYMKLLHADTIKPARHDANAVTITPDFRQNKQIISTCTAICTVRPPQASNFVYLHTAPREDAPYLSDAGLHPDGAAGTTEINDWSAKAVYGQEFAKADRQGDWTAIWFGGQRGWFYDPWNAHVTVPTHARLITPKKGTGSIPLYGRPVPEATAYTNGVPPLTLIPLQYSLFAGQSYPAYDKSAANDYYYVSTFDRSAPGDGTVVIGQDRYIPIEYNHRQAFVKASDVEIL
jgi:N-acetyl-anhydromuramyl-L-alanine amidase AmpD